MLTLKIDTDNAAFCGDEVSQESDADARRQECARILHYLADRLGRGMGPEDSGSVFDLNGNRVGSWELSA